MKRKKTSFSCGLCENKKFGSRQHLYEHYSQVHYRAQLRPFINEESAECSRCKIILKNPNVSYKIRHMGVVHELLELENILPRHLRIPKLWRKCFRDAEPHCELKIEKMDKVWSHQISLEAETIKDLDKTIKKNSDAGIPSRNDEITKEVAKADETSLKRPVWTVSERESVFCYSDSDE